VPGASPESDSTMKRQKRVFPLDPVLFSVNFVRKLRKHREIKTHPSIRQSLSIARLLIARFMRAGLLSRTDYVNIAVATSDPENKIIAYLVASELVFADEILKSFNFQKSLEEENLLSALGKIVDDDEKHEDPELEDELEKISKELSYYARYFNNNEADLEENRESRPQDKARQLQPGRDEFEEQYKFLEYLESNSHKEPVKSILEFMDGLGSIQEQHVKSMDDLIKAVREKILKQHDDFDPLRLKLTDELDIGKDLLEKTSNELEEFIIKSKMNLDPQEIVSSIFKDRITELLNAINCARTNQLLNSSELGRYVNEVKKMLSNHSLYTLKDVAASFGKASPQIFNDTRLLNDIFGNSLQSMSFNDLISESRFIDDYFGTDLEEQLNDFVDGFSSSNSMDQLEASKSQHGLQSLSEDDLLNQLTCPINSPFWRKQVKKGVQQYLNKLNQSVEKSEGESFSSALNLLDKTNTGLRSSASIADRFFMESILDDSINLTLEIVNNREDFMGFLEYLKKTNLKIDIDKARSKGLELGLNSQELLMMLSPNFDLVKTMVEYPDNDIDSFLRIMHEIKITPNQVEELVKLSSKLSNEKAICALTLVDMKTTMRTLENSGLASSNSIKNMIYNFGAGYGEQLLKQWFKAKHGLSKSVYNVIKDYIKKILVELSIQYSNLYLGTADIGPNPQTELRSFNEDDEFDNIDLEASVLNIIESGKSMNLLDHDDLLVNVTKKGKRAVVIEIDVSGSMASANLDSIAIAALMMLYKFDAEEIAICFFESDLYILKELSERADIEKIADKILSLEPMGGTMLKKALEWANMNLEKYRSGEKINILFTDAEIYDAEECRVELLKMASNEVKMVLVVPKFNFSGTFAKKIIELTNGTILKLEEWEDFPKLISKIFRNQ